MGIKSLFVILVFCSLSAGCLRTGTPFFDHNPFNSGKEDGDNNSKGVSLVNKNPDKPFRPKVFLVLSPGVSRTFAHVGVLKKLAESEIKVAGVVGLGWSGLAAAEYAAQGSVHGLEWKLSRSEELKGLVGGSFWSKAPVEKKTNFVKGFVDKFLTAEDSSKVVSKAYFPLLSVRARRLVFSDKEGLKFSMSVPPLFDSGVRYEPYLFDYGSIIAKAKAFGAEKVILIDVLSARDGLWNSKSARTSALKSYWAFATQALYQSHTLFDKVFTVKVDTNLTDFKNPLNAIKMGEARGEDLIDFLKTEYQY